MRREGERAWRRGDLIELQSSPSLTMRGMTPGEGAVGLIVALSPHIRARDHAIHVYVPNVGLAWVWASTCRWLAGDDVQLVELQEERGEGT